MFTGIVQGAGRVIEFTGPKLRVELPEEMRSEPFSMGESIAVNGCCLTVVRQDPDLEFDLSEETIRRTSFRSLDPGSRVNLERAMRASDRFGGHIVQGHVDTVGEFIECEPTDQAHRVRFRVPREYDRFLIDKGSIAIDGISLTIVEPMAGAFDVWIIPHTMAVTNLGEKKPGDPVNIEFDVIAKHVEKLLAWRG